ncbi:hypothetical protein L6452_29865 [Arctium lappa]|uniref:Uncharacterized protein n=1 Tax=Arctium lappa TaxID=4217 RepID=A0ACB8ZGM2_ARCLA|nr:hypothetical protein L6452_29865 [Arctium lappa]
MFLCIFIAVVTEGCFWSKGYFINVVNDINDGGNDTVVVHVQSKDDDIGEKLSDLSNPLTGNYVRTSLLQVLFSSAIFIWIYKQQVFDVYNGTVKPECVEKPKRDYWRYTWLIKRDGFYFVHRGDTRHEIKADREGTSTPVSHAKADVTGTYHPMRVSENGTNMRENIPPNMRARTSASIQEYSPLISQARLC